MALSSQQPSVNWDYGTNQGANPMYGMGDMLAGNMLGSYLGFGNNLQNAMGQMAAMNLANQQAKLYNNNLNTQLGQSQITGNALLQQALANAFGNIGSSYQNRMAVSDQLNNPTMQNYLNNNSGVAVANAQSAGALERIKQLPSIIQSLGGIFNLGGAGGSGSGGGLLGFQGSGGQSAILGGSQPSATNMAVKASQPLPQQAANQAVSSPSIVQQLQSLLQRQNPNSYMAA